MSMALRTRTLKLMTYNVWNQQKVSLDRRIKAIVQLVKQHLPGVAMLQELAPKMIQNSEWPMDYKYMLPPNLREKKGSFSTMMGNIPMETELIKLDELEESKHCVASINFMGRSLLLATCHLKSPLAPKILSKDMRRNQADELLRKLAPRRNVVVGGDMNWNEDGIADWPSPWVDAWTVLRPEEAGYTYDTVRNKMIANSKRRQARLDRFVCKLQYFKLEDIEIIGTEAADDVPTLYRNEERPLWPSDHFGLVLTISAK